MKKLFFSLAFILNVSFSFAQEIEKAPVIKLLEAMNIDQTMSQTIDAIAKTPAYAAMDIPKEVWDEFKKEFNSQNLMDQLASIYAKYYTEEEIIQLTEFYESPIGQKTIQVTPQLMGESMTVGQKMGADVMRKVIEKLDKLGYSRSS